MQAVREQAIGQCPQIQHQRRIALRTLTSLLHADPWSDTGVSVTNRSGFYIHGRGRRGSDGCIVPAIGTDLTLLLDAIESAEGAIPLFVHSEGVSAEKIDVTNFFKNAA